MINILNSNVSGYIMRIPERMIAMRKYIASRDRRVNILAHIRSNIAMARVEMIVERSCATPASANVIPASVRRANQMRATDPRRSEAVRSISTQRRTNTIDPVIKSIAILCHPSAMNPMRLRRNAIPPNATIEIIDMRD